MRTERIDLIEKYIRQQKTVTLDKLCEVFQVSKNTIRRDLNELTESGVVKKVYGGVTIQTYAPDLKTITPFSLRSDLFDEEKDAISEYAASLIDDYDIIFIDTGTTAQNLIDHIADKHCTVITNSLRVSVKAVAYPNLTIITLPGTLRRDTLSFIGSESVSYLEAFNINKAFLCCTGITIKNGLTNATTEEYRIKKSVVDSSQTCYALADHTKFEKFTLMTYCKLSEIQHIITDQLPNEEYITYCKEHDITLHKAT